MTIVAMTLRIDDELELALNALAESEGLSKQEVVRRAVLERYQRADKTERLERVMDDIMERWGDVLDRLGSA
jgi:predicted transcriptional regulator